MIARILDTIYRWRVRRAMRRNGWPLFVALTLVLGACAGRQIRTVNAIAAECEHIAPTTPADQRAARRAECDRRLEEHRR